MTSIIRAKTQRNRTAILDALNNASIHVTRPTLRRAEVVVDEELDDAFNGCELIVCIQWAEEARLHAFDVVEARGHCHGGNLGEGAAQVAAAVIARVDGCG